MRRGRCAPPRAGPSRVAERRVGGVHRSCRGHLRPDRFGPVGVRGDLLQRGRVRGIGAGCRLDRRSSRSAACADRFGCGSGGGFPCDGGDSEAGGGACRPDRGLVYRAIPVEPASAATLPTVVPKKELVRRWFARPRYLSLALRRRTHSGTRGDAASGTRRSRQRRAGTPWTRVPELDTDLHPCCRPPGARGCTCAAGGRGVLRGNSAGHDIRLTTHLQLSPARVRDGIRSLGPLRFWAAGRLLAGEHGHSLTFEVEVGIAADVDSDSFDCAAGERVRVRTRVVTGDWFAAVSADA
jgi:hypothetical protein